MTDDHKVIVSEHVLEVRHQATGRFLDVRGYVADHIKGADIFPHWEIDTNVVNFRDSPKKPEKLGAFAGFKSAGVFVYDPDTRNFFEDKSGKYWRTLIKNQFYTLPDLTRFGCRTKAFLNSEMAFEDINKKVYAQLFKKEFQDLVGDNEKDFQTVVEFSTNDFEVRLAIGPIHKEEAGRYFSFESDHFTDTGLFLDLDFSKTKNLQQSEIPNLTKKAMNLTWKKIDMISKWVGL
jgi:hypothetical protein